MSKRLVGGNVGCKDKKKLFMAFNRVILHSFPYDNDDDDDDDDGGSNEVVA